MRRFTDSTQQASYLDISITIPRRLNEFFSDRNIKQGKIRNT